MKNLVRCGGKKMTLAEVSLAEGLVPGTMNLPTGYGTQASTMRETAYPVTQSMMLLYSELVLRSRDSSHRSHSTSSQSPQIQAALLTAETMTAVFSQKAQPQAGSPQTRIWTSTMPLRMEPRVRITFAKGKTRG